MGESTNNIERIKKLIYLLNEASNAYYNSEPIISDYDWDEMYDELQNLEKVTGIIYPNSPTQNVGYTVIDKLKEVPHNHLMLSLDKTKQIDGLIDFAGNKACILSVKADGLSTTLRYLNGKLVSAETRGTGDKGYDCYNNVLTIKNIPKEIVYKDELIIDGETIIGWDTFQRINDSLTGKKYEHPRNLVSGSLTMLDSKEAAKRDMRFVAWRVIKGLGHKSVFEDLKEAEKNGFEVIPMWTYVNNSSDKENLPNMLENLQNVADEKNIPYDGAVLAIDDYKLAESMGRTDKFFRHSIAYKYEDELYETKLIDIEWKTSKSGLINPVAVFEPVNLEGALTTRATLHNITYIKKMMLGIGDRIRIYRSNKVIPKVHESIDKSGNFTIPSTCPICGGETKIIKENDSEVLICTNPTCVGKLLGRLNHAVSRNALNIEGLSEATIDKFISLGWLKSIKDIYHLKDYELRMKNLEGFGSKSVTKLLASIENSRKTTLDRFLYSLSIPLLGKTASKAIAQAEDYNYESFTRDMIVSGAEFFRNIPGIGDSLINSLNQYFSRDCYEIHALAEEFEFQKPEPIFKMLGVKKDLTGKTFVITGNLEHFSNRDEAKAQIESLGGKVSGSVSAKTSYLVNNNPGSTSSKNKKAVQLNIPIITEQELLSMIS